MWQVNSKIIGVIYLFMAIVSVLSIRQAFKDSFYLLAAISVAFGLIFSMVAFFEFKGALWVRYWVLPISGMESFILVLCLALCLVFGEAGIYGTAYFFVFHPEAWLYTILPKFIVERLQIQYASLIYCPLFLSMLGAHLFCFITSLKKPVG